MQHVPEILGELPPGKVVVKADMVQRCGCLFQHSTHLTHCGITASRDEDGFVQFGFILHMQLIIGHGIVGGLKPIDMFGFGQPAFA